MDYWRDSNFIQFIYAYFVIAFPQIFTPSYIHVLSRRLEVTCKSAISISKYKGDLTMCIYSCCVMNKSGLYFLILFIYKLQIKITLSHEFTLIVIFLKTTCLSLFLLLSSFSAILNLIVSLMF